MALRSGMTPLPDTKGKKIKYKTNRRPSQSKKKQSTDQAARTRKVICQGKGRACIRRSEGTVRLPKNTIPGSAETDGKTEYAVCPGKSDSGRQALPGSLMKCRLARKAATIHKEISKECFIRSMDCIYKAILQCRPKNAGHIPPSAAIDFYAMVC